MSTLTIIFFVTGLILGGGLATVVTSLIVRTKFLQAEADLLRERDGAQQAVKESDISIGIIRQTLKEATEKNEAKSERIMALEAEKGRLEGEATTLGTLRAEVLAKDKKLDSTAERLVALESAKADLVQQVKAIEASKLQALEANDKFVADTLNSMMEAYSSAIGGERTRHWKPS